MKQDSSYKNFIRNVKKILYDRDLTQLKLSKDMDYPPQVICRYLSGKCPPRLAYIDKLSKYLDVSVSKLLKDKKK